MGKVGTLNPFGEFGGRNAREKRHAARRAAEDEPRAGKDPGLAVRLERGIGPRRAHLRVDDEAVEEEGADRTRDAHLRKERDQRQRPAAGLGALRLRSVLARDAEARGLKEVGLLGAAVERVDQVPVVGCCWLAVALDIEFEFFVDNELAVVESPNEASVPQKRKPWGMIKRKFCNDFQV